MTNLNLTESILAEMKIVKGMEYVLNKYTSEHDREIIDQMLMTFTGWTLQTLLEKAEEVSDEEIEEL